MKKLFFLTLCFWVQVSLAQVPEVFSYQAVARDSSGICIADQSISLRISILDSFANGNVLYRELQSATTNAQGLFSIEIGRGTALAGTLADSIKKIPWMEASKYLQVEIDPQGGGLYELVGITELLSVPYALNAKNVAGEPVGTVKMFWNAGGILGIPADWMVLDGSEVDDEDSPLDGITLPNMINRYAIGAQGNLGTNVLGNQNHRININHSHTVTAHNHSISGHTHGPGSLRFRTASLTGTGNAKHLYFFKSNGLSTPVIRTVGVDRDGGTDGIDIVDSQLNEVYYTDDAGSIGATASGGNGSTGSSSPGTNSQLSASQSIQPESIGFIYIIKIK